MRRRGGRGQRAKGRPKVRKKGRPKVQKAPTEHVSTDHSKGAPSSDAVKETIKDFPWTLEVALSGGGHRATAYALGVLLYLVHTRLNERVRNIASVSGASITNAFVASQCDFQNVGIDEFRDVASQLISKVAQQGLLSARTARLCIATVVIAAIFYSLLFGIFWWGSVSDTWALHAWGAFLVLIISASVILFARGWVIDRWMAAVYFPKSDRDREVILEDVGKKSPHVDHVFCATELSSGRPFFFSSAFGGRQISRFYGRSAAPGVPLKMAVRASSAFPPAIPAINYELFPPDQFIYTHREGLYERTGPYISEVRTRHLQGIIWLTDGGAFNNFGTDWNLARRVVVTYDQHWGEQLLRQYRPDDCVEEVHGPAKCVEEVISKIAHYYYYGEVQLVADSSTPQRWIPFGWDFHLPIWGLLKYVVRTMNVMYGSTLEARAGEANYVAIARMERSKDRWWPDPAKPREDFYKERADRFWAFNEEFSNEGPLQIYVTYQIRPDVIYNWWKGRPRFTSARRQRWDDHPGCRGDGEQALGKDLAPENLEIVPTTFRSLKGQALNLVVAGYLNTREAIYGPFDYLPEPIPDREWFVKLLPSYDDRPPETLRRRLRIYIMQRLTRLITFVGRRQS